MEHICIYGEREGAGGSGGACVFMGIHIYIYIYLHACVVRGAVQTQARKFAHQEPETYCAFLHVVKPVGREQQNQLFFTLGKPVRPK
jgi:hypothetical protein